MTDPWQATAPITPQRPRGFSPGTIAILATATVLLAVAGLAIGWYVADSEQEPQTQASASPSVVASPSPSVSPSPSELPSPTPTPEPSEVVPSGTDLVMPDVTTLDFRAARLRLMSELKVTVTVRFDEPGDAGKVVRTSPAAGLRLRPGTHVTVYVAGPTAEFPMPNVVGQPCETGRRKVLDEGLRIGSYPTGRAGVITATSIPADTIVKWNASVDLTCTVGASTAPSPVVAE